jgi:hypothetical protein
MSTKGSIDDVIADGERIIRVWRENPAFSMGDVTLAQLEAMMTDLRTLRGQIETTRTQLTHLVNQSNDKLAAISTAASRARSGFRAFFGPDSSQYEQAGGTRASERKPRAPRKKTS